MTEWNLWTPRFRPIMADEPEDRPPLCYARDDGDGGIELCQLRNGELTVFGLSPGRAIKLGHDLMGLGIKASRDILEGKANGK